MRVGVRQLPLRGEAASKRMLSGSVAVAVFKRGCVPLTIASSWQCWERDRPSNR